MANMLMSLIKNYARHPFYNKYPLYFREEMVAGAMCAVWQKLGGFDRSKGENYFAYFTQVAKNEFFAALREYYKNKNKNVPMAVMEHFLSEDEG